MASTSESASGDQDEAANSVMSQDHPKGRCRLLELPAELQLYIYELAVVEPKAILINWSDYSFTSRYASMVLWKDTNAGVRNQPPLSRTCTAIRGDVLKIYYKRNHFMAEYRLDRCRVVFVQVALHHGPRQSGESRISYRTE